MFGDFPRDRRSITTTQVRRICDDDVEPSAIVRYPQSVARENLNSGVAQIASGPRQSSVIHFDGADPGTRDFTSHRKSNSSRTGAQIDHTRASARHHQSSSLLDGLFGHQLGLQAGYKHSWPDLQPKATEPGMTDDVLRWFPASPPIHHLIETILIISINARHTNEL